MAKFGYGLIVVLCIFLPVQSSAESVKASKNEEVLVKVVEQFFTDFLIKRNFRKLPAYLATKPIMGKCVDLGLSNKEQRKASSRSLLMKAFAMAIPNTSEKKNLSEIFKPTNRLSEEDRNTLQIAFSKQNLFQIYRMKNSTAHYICKFDERSSFRLRVNHPDVYYVQSEWNNPDGAVLQTLWVKEKNKWKLLTLAMLED